MPCPYIPNLSALLILGGLSYKESPAVDFVFMSHCGSMIVMQLTKVCYTIYHILLADQPLFSSIGMNVIIGSSKESALEQYETLKSNHSVEVWSKPGGTFWDMHNLVDNHLIYHHGGPSYTDQTHFYIIAGVV
jgi:hypothetical protein